MKIEKVNDHQIRCTLTKADLADRHMKLSELAYGTEKTKSLFRDMMQQAAYEFGFEAEDIPLMIEAIPLSGDCIVLIITKVEDPEELDTRFSRFAPDTEEDDEAYQDNESATPPSVTAGDVLDLFKKLRDGLHETAEKLGAQVETEAAPAPSKEAVVSVADDLTRLYELSSLDDAIRLAHILKGYYDGQNTLYRCDNPPGYYLTIQKSGHTPEQFNKVCNILSEYSQALRYSKGNSAYLAEHAKVILEGNALQSLAKID